MELYIKKIDEAAILPTVGSLHSAGYDFYALKDETIPAFGSGKVSTGVAVGWSDPMVYMQLHSRSGLYANHAITCEGGVIDWDYLQEIIVLLQNHSALEYSVKKGDRICQGVFLCQPLINRCAVVSDWISVGVTYFPFALGARTGGLGSTGK